MVVSACKQVCGCGEKVMMVVVMVVTCGPYQNGRGVGLVMVMVMVVRVGIVNMEEVWG